MFLTRLKENINQPFPKEAQFNPMMVQKEPISIAVQPHNYRLYYDFQKVGFNPTQPYIPKNYNSELHFTYPTHRIVVKKTQIEIIYLAHQKQWRRITTDTEEKINLELKEIDENIFNKCLGYFKDFIANNGGLTHYQLLKTRKQDWGIKGVDFLDNIPKEMIINTDICKKVYRDKVEFYGVNEVSNLIKNRALETYSPQIAKEINDLSNEIKEIKTNPEIGKELKRLSEEINSIKEVEKLKIICSELINTFSNYIKEGLK